MKAIFVGPSLARARIDLSGLVVRPPAAQGAIAEAVLEGFSAIGLIDGTFETTASVWHKEILFALDRGVHVMGAASMGALRAAECQAFGMEPVGRIAEAYCSGQIVDDAAVALLHAPAEAGGFALTEALVDAEATIEAMRLAAAIDTKEAGSLLGVASALFFQDRTQQAIVAGLRNVSTERSAELLRAYRIHRCSVKESDAILLVQRLKECPDERRRDPVAWKMALPATWTRFVNELGASVTERNPV